MVTAITREIQVDVESFYQVEYSNCKTSDYMFAYRITITNYGEQKVKLMRRHWFITESAAQSRQVEGEGVIGEQPILKPGESFTYVSGCGLKSEMGKMFGTYLFQNLVDNKLFYVVIPEFNLIAKEKLN